jgi:hypothetical protein
VTLAGRLEQQTSEGLVGPEEQVVTQEGEGQGGGQLPKSISALKQAWRRRRSKNGRLFGGVLSWELVFVPLTLFHPVRPSPNTSTLLNPPQRHLPLLPLSQPQRPRRHQTLPRLDLFGASL